MKIELILKKLFLIYEKGIKRRKIKYFFKFRNNIILSIKPEKKERKEKRKIYFNNGQVYERLFNYSMIREKILSNLSNKYLIDEEDKYPFIPKINSRDSNFYTTIRKQYELPHKDIQFYSDRNCLKRKSFNKLMNLKSNIENFTSKYIKKNIPYIRYKNYLDDTKKYSASIQQNDFNFSDINNRSFNPTYLNTKNNKRKIGGLLPVSSKNGYNHLNNNIIFSLEKENADKNYNLNNEKLNKNNTMNKSNSCQDYFSNKLFKKNKLNKNDNLYHELPNPVNISNISRNNDLKNYLKGKIKKDKKEYLKEILIPKRNGKNIEHEKKLVRTINSNSSIYNKSSLGGSLLKENLKLKSRQSSNKKERLFSFGSDLLFVDNKNSNLIKIKSDNKKNNLCKRNNSLKIGSYSKRSQKYQVSTKSSGTNTNSIYNNYMLNGYKEKNKNGIEKNNNFEIQSINEYSIINDLDNDIFNLQTTLQTLTDSKLLEMANNYVSEDDSLIRYKRKVGIYNKI